MVIFFMIMGFHSQLAWKTYLSEAYALELLIGTRKSKDSQVQAGLAVRVHFKGLVRLARALLNDCFGQFSIEIKSVPNEVCALVAPRGVKTRVQTSQSRVICVNNNSWSKLTTENTFLTCLVG